ncbi:MAG: hypothetical protein QNJ42_14295 [Crocosphaera sp.]|nr:hypothetical protein [Crocosphaera sp.]
MGKFTKIYSNHSVELENFLANLHSLIISSDPDDQKIYYKLLTTFDFLEDKINHPKFGLGSLIKDYDLINDLETKKILNSGQIDLLRLIQRTLKLSSHGLNKDPNQLVGQLWGRLQGLNNPDIEKLLKDAKDSNSKHFRLRPLTASLTSPESPLICNLTGHQRTVTAVVITPDGKKAVSASVDAKLKLWDLEIGKEVGSPDSVG